MKFDYKEKGKAKFEMKTEEAKKLYRFINEALNTDIGFEEDRAIYEFKDCLEYAFDT